MKYKSKFTQSILDIINQIAIEEDREKLNKLENLFLVKMYVPSLILLALSHIIPIIVIKKNILLKSLLALSFIISAIIIATSNKFIKREKLRTHVITAIVCINIVIGQFVHYPEVGIIYWITILIFLLPTMFTISYIPYLYSAIASVIMTINLQLFNVGADLDDFGIKFTFVVFYICMLFIIIASKWLYKSIVIFKQKQYKDIYNQKEEITALYEEQIATEKELMETNQKLTAYNKVIENSRNKLNFFTNYDPLTSLPNRKYMIHVLNKMLSSENVQYLALVHIDIKNFSDINDSLSHQVGDILLNKFAKRLSENIDEVDFLARIGGDEFSLIIISTKNKEEVDKYLNKLINSFSIPFTINENILNIKTAIGVAFYNKDATDANELIKSADIAMHKCKIDKSEKLVYFENGMMNEIVDHFNKEDALSKAAENKEFIVEYQPLISTKNLKIIGFEALVRWISPKLGRVSPLEFITLAEGMGIIDQISNFVLNQICMDLSSLKTKFGDDIYISFNLSPIQLYEIKTFEDIEKTIKKHNTPTKNIVAEITESTFMANAKVASQRIEQIRDLGIKIAIDDFGTGYSSLEHLASLQFDILKIDKSFIDLIDGDSNEKLEFISSIIDLGKSLNLNIVAEGVESKSQVDKLSEINCDYLQGYYFSKPLSKQNILFNEALSKLQDK